MTEFSLNLCFKCCGSNPTERAQHDAYQHKTNARLVSSVDISEDINLGIYAQLEKEVSNVSTLPPSLDPNWTAPDPDDEGDIPSAMAAGAVGERQNEDTRSAATGYSRQSKKGGKNPTEVNFNYLKNLLLTKGFNVGKELSRGSFAIVRSAEKLPDKTPLAVKVVDCSKAPEDFVTHFFPRELKVIRELKHENIIEVVDIVKVSWFTCIFMERADNGDILDYIMKHGAMDNSTAQRMFRETALALHYCHSVHVAHRDLKCENILLTKNNKVKLADFGFARGVMKDNVRQLSQTYCGSAAYAAPEVIQGEPYNPLMSDMWSLGVVLYIMVCAIMPFDDSSHRRMLEDQLSKRWTFNPDRKAHIDPQCRRLVRMLLEPDLTKRASMRLVTTSAWLKTPSAENFMEDLAKVAMGKQPSQK